MNLNLSIKGVPEHVAERLRQRAERNHRSLQGELMAIIQAAAAQEAAADHASGAAPASPAATATATAAGSAQVQGWKTVDQLLAERRARSWTPHPSLAAAPLGVDIVRADRDSR